MRRALLVALVLSVALASPCAALERERVAAVRSAGPIRVDGVLDEADWARAVPITALRLIEDREGEAPSESTEVRVLFDDAHVYFGFRCFNRGPGAIRGSLAPRDQILELDYAGMLLDTYQDRHRAYAFAVNPYGVQMDGIYVGEELSTEWDGVWDAEVARGRGTRDSGSVWTAEFAIPLRTLSFPGRGPGAWGLMVRRQIAKNAEVCTWPPLRAAVAGDDMLQAADLTGLDGLRGGGLFDLQPYAAAAWSTRRDEDGAWEDRDTHDVGVDARVPLTSSLTLSATVNPDFSQVEADALQIDVNQRYPLFYDEKRPFFLEGADIFSTAFDLIYTRRIADPAYGVKLTGRVGDVRVGGMVLRDDGGGSLAGVGGGPDGGVSGRGWFQLGRAAWEFGENSSVGALVALHRTDGAFVVPGIVPDEPCQVWNCLSLETATNAVYALDADLRLSRRWFFHGQLAGSRTHASGFTWGLADWDSAGVPGIWNTVRTQRNDHAYGAELDYDDGIRELTLIHQYVGPDFRAESGFLSQVDFRRTRASSSFYVRPQNAVLRSVQSILEGYVLHDPGGRLREWWWGPMVDWRFQKQTNVWAEFGRWQERWRERDHLGNRFELEVENTQWKPLAVELAMDVGDGIYYGDDDASSYLGWLEEYRAEGTLRPSPRLTVELEAERNRFSRDHGRGVAYDVWTLGAKATWQFTRRLYVRLYPQVDTDAEHLDADALVGYVLHPGSVLYLGYNGDADRLAGRTRATGHTAFLKVSYRFQR
jgi:hypothetical protein